MIAEGGYKKETILRLPLFGCREIRRCSLPRLQMSVASWLGNTPVERRKFM